MHGNGRINLLRQSESALILSFSTVDCTVRFVSYHKPLFPYFSLLLRLWESTGELKGLCWEVKWTMLNLLQPLYYVGINSHTDPD